MDDENYSGICCEGVTGEKCMKCRDDGSNDVCHHTTHAGTDCDHTKCYDEVNCKDQFQYMQAKDMKTYETPDPNPKFSFNRHYGTKTLFTDYTDMFEYTSGSDLHVSDACPSRKCTLKRSADTSGFNGPCDLNIFTDAPTNTIYEAGIREAYKITSMKSSGEATFNTAQMNDPTTGS